MFLQEVTETVPKSKQNIPRRVRAALTLRGLSVPMIARKHGASVSSLYAVLHGQRSGIRTPALQRAMKELRCA